mgnify:CR=1 FL=1
MRPAGSLNAYRTDQAVPTYAVVDPTLDKLGTERRLRCIPGTCALRLTGPGALQRRGLRLHKSALSN